MGGGKGGGSGTSTQYSGVQIPQEVMARYNKATDRAENTSQQPWQNYSGEFVAPVNATQQGGYNTMMGGQGYTDWGFQTPNASINQGINAAAPLLDQASGSINTGQVQGQALGGAGLGQAAQAYNQAQPYNQQAGQAFNQAYGGAQPYNQMALGAAGMGMQGVDPNQLNLQQFLNPYQQQVTEATMAQLNQQQAQQRNDQRGNMIREGSWGGDRGGIANANMVNQQNMATGSVLSGLNQQNYNQALAAAQQQQGVGLGAAQANRAAYQQGAGQLLGIGQQGYAQGMGYGQAQQGLGNQAYTQGMGQAQYTGNMGQQLYGQGIGAGQAQGALGAQQYGMWGDAAAKQAALGNQAFTQNMQTAQGQMGFGSLQQQTQQAQDSAAYNQWMQERGYPFQTSQFYTNAVMGTGPLSGSQAYGGSFTPQPFFSDERLKENMEPIGTTHDGQIIYRYNYKGQPGATQLGLSAQEVERRHPEAVTEHDGAKAVAYGPATDDAAQRPHKAGGGPLGGDVFGYQPPNTLQPGVGVLGTPPTLPSATPVTGGNIGDIVATQRAMLAANAPGGRPASSGPPSDAGMTTPGAPPSGMGPPTGVAPAGPAAGPAAAAPGFGPAAIPFTNASDGSANGATGDSSGSATGEAGSVGAGVGTAAGDAGATAAGTSGSDASTGGPLASGGRVGYAKSGEVQPTGFGSMADILANQQAMYGSVPWAGKGAAGVGNAGIVGAAATPAKASAVLKPPESKTPAASKPTIGGLSDVTGTVKDAEKAYDAGKGALFGTKAKGKPGDKDYEPESGGLFGRGGDRSKRGWIDNLFGSGTDTTDSGAWDERAPNPADVSSTSVASGGRIDGPIKDYARGGGATGLGRAQFKEGGETDEIDAPFTEHSVLPEIPTAEASKAPTPPDPKGEGSGGGGGGKGKDQTASAAMKLAGLGASFIPGIGQVAGPLLSIGSSFVKDGGRIGRAEGGDIPLRDPGLGAADTDTPQSLYGPGGPGARDLDDWRGKDEEFPWDLQSSTGNVPPPREGGVAPSKRAYENSRTYSFADGGEVNDNEPLEPGLASASSAIEDNDNVHWGVFSRSQGHKMVGRATSKNRARTIRDKRDNEYGAYDHFVKPIPPTRKRYAGGRAGFADAGEVALADDEAERRLVEERLRARDEGLGAATAEARPAPTFAPMGREPDPNVKPAPMPQPETPPGAIPGGHPAPMPNGLGTATTDSTTPPAAVPGPSGLSPIAQAIATGSERQKEAGQVGANLQGVQVADVDPNTAPKPAVGTERFNAVVGQTLGFEGGLNVDSNGYAVNYGINQKFHPKVDVKKLTQDQAKEIYHREYWSQIDGDNLPPNMQAVVMDAAVNSGVAQAKAWLAQSGNDPQKFMELRREFLTNLAKSDPKQYGPGVVQSWNKRLVALGGKPIEGFGGATTQTTPQTPDATPTGSALGAAQNVLGDSKSMYGENKDWWDRNEQWSMPLLQGIGAMLSSPSRTLLGSIGTGLEKGAGTYSTLGQRQQQLDISKQTQNIAAVGKLQDSMNQISREKAGILLDNPMADVSAYDKAYQQMQNQQLKYLGVTNIGLGLPPQMVDWIKNQPQEIQAFTARVHQSDNPFTLYRIAAGTQDPTERQRIMEQAKAAADRAASGPVRGKDGNPVTLSQEMINQLLQMRTRTAEAGAAGTPDVWQQQLTQAQTDYDAWAKSNPNPSTPELQAKDAEFRKRIADLQAKIRAGGGGGQRAMGGRVGRADGGPLMATDLRTDDEGNVPVDVAQAPVPVPEHSIQVPADPAGIVAGRPGEPSVAPPPKPATPSKRDEHDANFWYQHAQKMDSVGNKAAADDARTRAKTIEKQQLDTAVTTTTGPDGKPVFTYNQQVGEAKQRQVEQETRAAVNQKLLDEAYRISLAGRQAEQQYESAYNQMFDAKTGKARMPMGPATEGTAKVTALLGQFLPEQLIKDLTGLDPANKVAYDKAIAGIAQAMATSAVGSRPTEDQVRTFMQTAVPNMGMPEAAAKFLFEHALLPKAKFDKGMYGHIAALDPVTSNYRNELHKYSIENNQILPGSLRGNTEEKQGGAQPAPTDAKGNPDVSKMTVNEFYIINGRPYRLGRDGKFYAP